MAERTAPADTDDNLPISPDILSSVNLRNRRPASSDRSHILLSQVHPPITGDPIISETASMNAPVRTVYVSTLKSPARFEDFAAVRLVRAVTDRDGRRVPAESVGTVVALWANGAAYEVEFEKPFHTLACVEVEHLEADVLAL